MFKLARKILVTSGKGGAGKSTVTASLGKVFASEGIKTLLVDCDAGLSSLDIMFDCRESSTFSWQDAYLGRCTPEDAVISLSDSLSLLCAPQKKLEDASTDSVRDIIDKIEDKYDIIIIDSPAGLGRGAVRAAKAADMALIVATGDEISVSAAEKIDRVIRDCGIRQTRLLINRYNVRDAKRGKLLTVDEIIDKTFVQLIGIIPESKEIMYSTVTRKISKRNKAIKAFRRIADRITGKNVELILSELK